MIHFHQNGTAAAWPGSPGAGALREPANDRTGAVLVPFPAPCGRRSRRAPRTGERRGEILLFLGVRYERLAS